MSLQTGGVCHKALISFVSIEHKSGFHPRLLRLAQRQAQQFESPGIHLVHNQGFCTIMTVFYLKHAPCRRTPIPRKPRDSHLQKLSGLSIHPSVS